MADDPIPAYFGWRYAVRYIGWFLWTHAIATLSSAQLALGSVLLALSNEHIPIPPKVYVYIVITNSVMTMILSVINRSSPPPTKGNP